MTPAYRVLADDNDITTAIRHRLLSLRVTDEAGYQSDAVEIQLDDRGNKIALLRKGVKLDIALGYEEIGLAAMGLFAVDEIELNGCAAAVGREPNRRRQAAQPRPAAG